MAKTTSGPRLLVKSSGPVGTEGLGLGVTGASGLHVPLLPSIEGSQGLGVAPGPRWYSVDAERAGIAEPNAWDLCHSLVVGDIGLSAAQGGIEFAEPDLQQRWLTGDEGHQAFAMAEACGPAERQDDRFPKGPSDTWFKDRDFGELADAAARLGRVADRDRVRIAHLDTGYDPRHATVPERVERSRERNFVEADRPNDASDVTDGLFTNLGHGTGTLGILAGGPLRADAAPVGGAPFAFVVPVRVADSVVLFRNSAIARALDYVHALCGARGSRVDVVTMSMGGLPSQAWAEAVNALYDAGVFIVTAAGNNYGNLPTRHVVYPARFGRVTAACGVMANHTAYADLGFDRMAGNYGPASKMGTAISAFTPNTPWARLGCPDIVDLNGAGTSSATPQIAAAAAIWIQRNRAALARYSAPWMRVEAVRKALFESAAFAGPADPARLGRGEIRALGALGHPAAREADLRRTPEDSTSFPLLRTLTGLGVSGTQPDARQRMLELEALQLAQSAEVQALLPDPHDADASLSGGRHDRIIDALASQPGASKALRDALLGGARATLHAVPAVALHSDSVSALHLKLAVDPPVPKPARRRLKVYAYDPALETRLETLGINQATLGVRWEDDLKPGPVGEYLEVIDVDPSSRCCYAPVDLSHPHLLVQDGLSPSEANPQFHQQMVYAVAMRTIEHFETALGRRALWASRVTRTSDDGYKEDYIQRLRIYPHALRAANAYYSPDKRALLFGYFVANSARPRDTGSVMPGGVVFSAVSHDIIAHETTHALLDGLHTRFREPTNPDVLAFHEAFADIVALFQHFSIPEALKDQIARTRGDLGKDSLLAKLAVQFGEATNRDGALRDAIGKIKDGRWMATVPTGSEYDTAKGPHHRGAILVAAVFDAFLQIYRQRAADLVRLATNGSGVLPEGHLPDVLVDRMSREASKVAGQILAICIRALDYCPPVDITFGEYLRALITADRDAVPDDRRTYRVAFISAFRDRGIYPSDVRHLSVESLAWEPPPLPLANVKTVLDRMSLRWDLTSDRRSAFDSSRSNAKEMHDWLVDPAQVPDDQLAALGFVRKAQDVAIGERQGRLGGIEVHSVRPARRIGADGLAKADLVVEITQTFYMPNGAKLRGGVTLLIDLQEHLVRYLVRKRVQNEARLERQLTFMEGEDPGLNPYFDARRARSEPFALLHRHD